MKKIKVTGCSDCPFCIHDFDDSAVGYDTYVYCHLMLLNNRDKSLYTSTMLVVYDSYLDNKVKITTPKWGSLTELNIKKV